MLPTEVQAVQFVRTMTAGRTGPFLAVVEDGASVQSEVVVKVTGPQLPREGLIREAMAALAGRALSMPIPRPYIVHLDSAFVRAVAHADPILAARLASACPVAFGSERLPPGYVTWTSSLGIPAGCMQTAAEILAFDVCFKNPDRLPKNPNMQWNGTSFALFDHELALVPSLFLALDPPVWYAGAASRPVGQHIFGAELKSTVQDLGPFRARWASLPDAVLNAFVGAIPKEWALGTSAATDALALIRDVRDNIDAAVNEVLRALQ